MEAVLTLAVGIPLQHGRSRTTAARAALWSVGERNADLAARVSRECRAAPPSAGGHRQAAQSRGDWPADLPDPPDPPDPLHPRRERSVRLRPRPSANVRHDAHIPMNKEPYTRIVSTMFPGAKLEAVTRLAGGVSADVRRLDLCLADGSPSRVVVRAHGASHSGHAAVLEYQLLRALYRGGVPVPKPLHVDVSGEVLADPFLVMAFVDGATAIPVAQEDRCIDEMANVLGRLHAFATADLPLLPARIDPLPDLLDYLPEGAEWEPLRIHLRSLGDTAYVGAPKLLHGDFWPENLLWRNGAVVAILDWEDAALGDPLSDVACSRVELRYRFGKGAMQRFTEAYGRYEVVDVWRLALWQVYVAAAAQRFMGKWGLAPAREAHMRGEALASIREAGAVLMGQTAQ
jgi:aminoglycoside phosphotransferase (APT) family kinase protein